MLPASPCRGSFFLYEVEESLFSGRTKCLMDDLQWENRSASTEGEKQNKVAGEIERYLAERV